MKQIKFSIFLLTFALLASSTSVNEKNSVEDFYFPVKDMFVEKVYTYVNQLNKSEKLIWKMKTTIVKEDTIFTTWVFNEKNEFLETFTEKFKNGDSDFLSYTFLNNNDTIKCVISDSKTFKFDQQIGEEIEWRANFRVKNNKQTYAYIKKRTLLKQDKNKRKFSDRLLFSGNGKLEMLSERTSVYKKEKGLVSFTMFKDERIISKYVLEKID